MNELEVLRLMNGLAEEIHELRKEVLKLSEAVAGKARKGKFLTIAEACEYLHISRSTMQKRIAEGEITFAVKRGKSYLLPEELLREYATGIR